MGVSGTRLRVAFGSDEMTPTAEAVRGFLESAAELEVVDLTMPWPIIARSVAEAVAAGRCDRGVVMCWSGTGSAIAANKVAGVRAAQASEAWVAEAARRWNDANVLALSSMRLAPMVAIECVGAFLATGPDPEEAENIDCLKGL